MAHRQKRWGKKSPFSRLVVKNGHAFINGKRYPIPLSRSPDFDAFGSWVVRQADEWVRNSKSAEEREEIKNFMVAIERCADEKKARKDLLKRDLSKSGFEYALRSLSSNRAELRRCRKLIEKRFARLPKGDRKSLRKEMCEFYWIFSDYRNAEKFVLDTPRQWLEVPREMAVYLRLKHRRKARELATFCEAKLEPEKHFEYENPLRHALSRYYASLGDYERARKHISLIDLQAFFRYEDYLTPIEIKTTEARFIAKIYQKQVRDYLRRKSLSDDARLLQLHHYLPQIVSRLERVMPPQLRQTGEI